MRSSVALGSLITAVVWLAAPLHAQGLWCREVNASMDGEPAPTWIARAGPGDLWWLPRAMVPAATDFVAWPFDPQRLPEERPAEGVVDVDTVAVDDVFILLRVPDVEAGTWLVGTADGDDWNRATVLTAPAADVGWATPPPPDVVDVRTDVELGVTGCVGPQILTSHEVTAVRLTVDPADASRLAIDVWNLADGEVLPDDGSGRAIAVEPIGGRVSTGRPIELRTALPGDRVIHVRTVDLATGAVSDIIEIPIHVAPPIVWGAGWFPVSETPACGCTAVGSSPTTGALVMALVLGVGAVTVRRRRSRLAPPSSS